MFVITCRQSENEQHPFGLEEIVGPFPSEEAAERWIELNPQACPRIHDAYQLSEVTE